MRISCITVVALALTSTSHAAPVKRGVTQAAQELVNKALKFNTTSSLAVLVAESVKHPKLTTERLLLLSTLRQAQVIISNIASSAEASGNTNVRGLVATGQQGLTSAHKSIALIGDNLASGTPPKAADQANVAKSIKALRDAVNQMSAAITTPDATLSSNIAAGQNTMEKLKTNALAVMMSTNTTFADLGLPNNFATS